MRYLVTAIALLLAPMASAAPIVTWSTNDIDLSPTQTTITFVVDVDPADPPLAGAQLIFSAPDPGLVILGVTPIDGDVTAFGPALNAGVWEATLQGFFLPPRGTDITVGSLTLEGFTPGTQLTLEAELTDELGGTTTIGPMVIATVVSIPEPGSLALVALGILGLAAWSRRRG